MLTRETMLTYPLLINVLQESADDSTAAIIGVICVAFLMLASAIVYFLPSLIAVFRGPNNWGAIAIVNLFLGWTFVGWVVALAWSVTGQHNNT